MQNTDNEALVHVINKQSCWDKNFMFPKSLRAIKKWVSVWIATSLIPFQFWTSLYQ